MNTLCKDADLARFEPSLFGDMSIAWQIIAGGENGQVSSSTFTASGGDFINRGVSEGQVIKLCSISAGLYGFYEIVSVDGAEQLTISVMRARGSEQCIPVGEYESLTYSICSYGPQACEVLYDISRRLSIRPGFGESEYSIDDIADTESLVQAAVYGTLALVYGTLCGLGGGEAVAEDKQKHYSRLYEKAMEGCRVWIDTDGDGQGDIELGGGSFRLGRG